MGQCLAWLIPAVLVGGCSLIYNPNNIEKPPGDARVIDVGETPVDVEIRADASLRDLTLLDLFPTEIQEGTGVMSREGVVVLHGHNFVKDASANLMVTITPATAGALVLNSFEISGNSDYIALHVQAPITSCHEGMSVPVNVKLEQNDGLGGTVVQTLDTLTVKCHEELTAAPTTLQPMYSKIDITSSQGLNLVGAAGASALLRSASFISISGPLDASAMAANPGPGGGKGGAAADAGGGGLKPGLRGTLGAGGGGGGFVVAGTKGTDSTTGVGGAPGDATGDSWISSYVTNASSGGGAGGSGTGPAGAGGGGGGTIELTAPGDVTIAGAVSANGAAGTAGGTLAGDGGSGTGGVIIIRSGGTLMTGAVSVTKGSATGNGGASSDGRARIDAAKGTYPAGTFAKGPMFVDLPISVTLQTPTINMRGTPNDATSTLRVFDKTGTPVANMTYTPVFGTTGATGVMVVLKAGYNDVCVWVQGGAPDVPESLNCQTIAYLPP